MGMCHFLGEVLMWTGGIVLYSPAAIVLYSVSSSNEEDFLKIFAS